LPAAEPLYLQVALESPLRRLFDYLPPDGVTLPPPAGVRVEVPFGRRTMIGVLVGTAGESAVPADRLKKARRILDKEPLLDAASLELLRFAADYYQAPLGEAIGAALPVLIRQGRSLHATETRWQRAPGVALPPRLGVRQRAVVELIARTGAVTATLLASLGPTARASAKSLVKQGILIESEARMEASGTAPTAPVPGPELNPAQASAVAAIAGSLGRYAPFLLHGVTGSGKTEVYLRAIERVLARGDQALVLVPEIGLTPQSVARFQARLGAPLAMLHSGMGDADRLLHWRAARSGQARVVIGTRSAVYAPLPRLGLIVIDEEHDTSYKQQEGFRYSARDLAVWRARRLAVPIVLGSATPALETLANVEAGRYARLDLPARAGGAGKPATALVDLRMHPSQQGLAAPSVAAMARHLEAGGQVLLYLNRRGFAPTLYCPGCGWMAPCESCDARLTVHGASRRLACHHCGATAPIPFACPRCETELLPVGQGTERIEESLADVFPAIERVRIDRDTVRSAAEFDVALGKVRTGEARILIGTQMLAKGHDFPDVSLVVVLNADQGLFGLDFRAAERLAQSIIQVAGRAGRASRPGEVLIQTSCPDHPLLTQLLAGGYDAFAKAALGERRDAHWPPYSHLALLRAEAGSAADAHAFLATAGRLAAPFVPGGVRLLGPAPAAMERRAGRYRAQILVRSDSRAALHDLLQKWVPRLDAEPAGRRVRWAIDVDPQEVT
jgi:primosomal protein N' (replication factor Y) (superfamily II helicase)